METLRVGDPLDKAIDIGAIVAPVQLERITALVAAGRRRGRDAAGSRRARCPTDGLLLSADAVHRRRSPPSTIAQVEIFGPVLVAMTFRTPDEAVALANNTRYGLAASVWTREHQPRARHRAASSRPASSGSTATNLFDAAAGFGGYRESGFGREGGREGMYEYLKPAGAKREAARRAGQARRAAPARDARRPLPALDRTAKLYHRRQAGAARLRLLATPVARPRRAGSSASRRAATARTSATPSRRRKAARLGARPAATTARRSSTTSPRTSRPAPTSSPRGSRAMTGVARRRRAAEVDAAIARLFTYAAWADKYDGAVHSTPLRGVALAMNEPIGVIGVVCPDEAPLLGFVVAGRAGDRHGQPRGRRAVASAIRWSATDFYQVLETSRRAGRRGQHRHRRPRRRSAKTLAEHDDVAALWYFGAADGERAGRAGLGRQPQADLGETAGRDWLGRSGEGAGPRVPAPRDAGEEHLDAVRRVAPASERTAPGMPGRHNPLIARGDSARAAAWILPAIAGAE